MIVWEQRCTLLQRELLKLPGSQRQLICAPRGAKAHVRFISRAAIIRTNRCGAEKISARVETFQSPGFASSLRFRRPSEKTARVECSFLPPIFLLEVVPHTKSVALLEVVVEFVLSALAVDVLGAEAERVESLAAADLPAALDDEVSAEV
jgi:hypothetical protein